LLLWIAGGGWGAARLVGRHRRFGRELADPGPVSWRVERQVRDLRRGADLRGRVTAFEAARLGAPVALSGGRIGLPRRASALLDDDELKATLAHELAHIVRRDPAWLLWLQGLEAIFWIQPLNVVARRAFQRSSEFLADEWAVQQTRRPLGLARSLEKVTTWLVEGRPGEPVPAMARAESPVVERVKRILSSSRRPASGSFRSLSAALLLPALLLPPVRIAPQTELRVMVTQERGAIVDPASRAVPDVTPPSRDVTTELHVEYAFPGP